MKTFLQTPTLIFLTLFMTGFQPMLFGKISLEGLWDSPEHYIRFTSSEVAEVAQTEIKYSGTYQFEGNILMVKTHEDMVHLLQAEYDGSRLRILSNGTWKEYPKFTSDNQTSQAPAKAKKKFDWELFFDALDVVVTLADAISPPPSVAPKAAQGIVKSQDRAIDPALQKELDKGKRQLQFMQGTMGAWTESQRITASMD